MWAWGALMVELLTGARPWPDKSERQIMYAVGVKRASPKLRVGGPVTCAGAAWISELRNFTREAAVPLDFISTHTYTGGNDHINDAERVTSVLRKARQASGELPLLITEFGSSYVPGSANATTATTIVSGRPTLTKSPKP